MNVQRRVSYNAFSVFDELRKNGQLCDVVLRCENQDFPSHRNILAACSPYFRALFTNGMHETQERVVNIPNTKANLLALILDYAYTRQVKITAENVEELLPAADQFNVGGLVHLCSEFLINHLGPDNCIGIWRFAKMYFCFKLQETAFMFILVHFEEIVLLPESEEFLSLTVDELVELLYEDQLNVKMEEYVFEAVLRWIRFKEADRKAFMPRLLMNIRLGMTNTDYFMNNIKAHPYVKNNDLCKPVIVQTINYTYNFDATAGSVGPSKVVSRPRLPYKVLFAVGGWSGGSPTSAIECYDTRADRWVMLDTVNNRPRAYMGVAVLGHNLFVIGGFDSNQYFNSVRMLEPQTRVWKEVAPMHSRRCYVSVAVLGGHIYAMGGFDGHTRLRSVERYEPETNQWSLIQSMNHHRSDASACAVGGCIVIVGGFNGNECLNTTELYDPEAREWRDLPRMGSRRSGVGSVSFRDYVYAVGGFNGLTRLNTMERWTINAPQWTPCPSMYIHRSNFGSMVLDDMIFIIGGFNGITTIFNVECFDPDNEEWYDACDMNVYRSALSIALIEGLPNVRQFTWPRDCDLPPPSVPPDQSDAHQPPHHQHRGVVAGQQQRQNNDAAVQAVLPAPDQAGHDAVDQRVADAMPELMELPAPEENEALVQGDMEDDAGDDGEEEEEEDDDEDEDEDDDDEDIEDEEEVQFPDRPPNHRRPPRERRPARV
ncbi:kelch-like protein 10 [Patiria miniata]|uniref:BTB domain-containing protein n=1 Tax=Patiria miniata TaxID=46514 RepID=A0A914BKC1_PATMI|nr:kelch-like protein 10 [Patiria miniata]